MKFSLTRLTDSILDYAFESVISAGAQVLLQWIKNLNINPKKDLFTPPKIQQFNHRLEIKTPF